MRSVFIPVTFNRSRAEKKEGNRMIHSRDVLLPALMARWILSDGLIVHILHSEFTSGEGQRPDGLPEKITLHHRPRL